MGALKVSIQTCDVLLPSGSRLTLTDYCDTYSMCFGWGNNDLQKCGEDWIRYRKLEQCNFIEIRSTATPHNKISVPLQLNIITMFNYIVSYFGNDSTNLLRQLCSLRN